MLDLSYLGQEEAGYVLKEARILLEKASDLQIFISKNNVTPKFLRYHLSEHYRGLTAEKGSAYIVINVYKELYETLANRLRDNLTRRIGAFPAMVNWLIGPDAETKHRLWWNICCHNAGVPPPYRYDEENTLFNRRFDPKGFLEEVNKSLQPLIKDLEVFVEQLKQDIDDYPVLDEPASAATVWNSEQVVAELVAVKHPGIIHLEDEQSRLCRRQDALNVTWVMVGSGDWDLRQKEAMMIMRDLCRAANETEAKMQKVYE